MLFVSTSSSSSSSDQDAIVPFVDTSVLIHPVWDSASDYSLYDRDADMHAAGFFFFPKSRRKNGVATSSSGSGRVSLGSIVRFIPPGRLHIVSPHNTPMKQTRQCRPKSLASTTVIVTVSPTVSRQKAERKMMNNQMDSSGPTLPSGRIRIQGHLPRGTQCLCRLLFCVQCRTKQ